MEPTCTEKGSYDSVVYCEVCDAEVNSVKVDIEATGHTPGEAAGVLPRAGQSGGAAHVPPE